MALKIFLIAIILFLAEVIFITTKEVDKSNFGSKDFYFTDVAFENINGYLISKDRIEVEIEAKEVLKYKDKAILNNIKANFNDKNKNHKINAQKAILKNSIIELSGNVHYKNNQAITIQSQKLTYNSKTKLIESKTTFKMDSLQGELKGDQFIYDQKNGKIESKNIHYISKKELK